MSDKLDMPTACSMDSLVRRLQACHACNGVETWYLKQDDETDEYIIETDVKYTDLDTLDDFFESHTPSNDNVIRLYNYIRAVFGYMSRDLVYDHLDVGRDIRIREGEDADPDTHEAYVYPVLVNIESKTRWADDTNDWYKKRTENGRLVEEYFQRRGVNIKPNKFLLSDVIELLPMFPGEYKQLQQYATIQASNLAIQFHSLDNTTLMTIPRFRWRIMKNAEGQEEDVNTYEYNDSKATWAFLLQVQGGDWILPLLDVFHLPNHVMLLFNVSVTPLGSIRDWSVLSDPLRQLQQILTALVKVHEAGILHNGISTSSIFVDTKEGDVYLGNFQYAMTHCRDLPFDQYTLPGVWADEIDPPEWKPIKKAIATAVMHRKIGTQIPKVKMHDNKADIWMLGMVFICICSRSHDTWTTMQENAIAYVKMKNETVQIDALLGNIPDAVTDENHKKLIELMLTPDPDKRPSAEELLIQVNKRLTGHTQ